MRPTFLCHHSPEEKKKLTVRNTDIPLGILKYRNLLFRLGKTSHISMNSKTGYNLQYAFFYQSQPKKKKAQRHTERQAMSAISWRSQPLPHQHTPFHSLASPKDMSEGRHCPQHTFPHTHTETCWPCCLHVTIKMRATSVTVSCKPPFSCLDLSNTRQG